MAQIDLSRCSSAARRRGDPLAGSAPVASRWLLIEHPGPWSKKAIDTPPLGGRVGAELESTCASFGGQVLLIRRQGRRSSDSDLRMWYAIDTVRGTWLRGAWRTPEDLLQAARALGTGLSASDEDAEQMILVCTQGTRDACCAVRGRPIVAKLDRLWPEETWECTHLGGHRFAGTLLSLPDGTCYGYLDTDPSAKIVSDHLAGQVSAEHLRGVTRWEPEVQAAVAAVLREHGPAGLEDAIPGRVDPGEPDETIVQIHGRGPVPERLLVSVRREELPDEPLSCGAGAKAHVAYRATLVESA